jgi:hypothetical protein
MSDLFIEVDEAMKQERLEKIWKDYGGLFISFLAMVILATAANSGYRTWVQHRDFKQTSIYLDVLSQDNPSADDLLALLPDMTTGMKSVVSMRAADFALKGGDKEKALSIYQSVETDTAQQKSNPMLSALAKYMVTGLDKNMSTEEKIKRYEAMASDENNPWRYNALLDAAILEATQNNDYAKARTNLSNILSANSKATQGMKQKAQSLEILYQAQQSENK